ncbi:hypothetical protein NL676_009838 [Syzygium grande]|nr:hypothetical protein NL676_009838 [Syzygium grande]
MVPALKIPRKGLVGELFVPSNRFEWGDDLLGQKWGSAAPSLGNFLELGPDIPGWRCGPNPIATAKFCTQMRTMMRPFCYSFLHVGHENDDESNGVRRPSATLGGISVGLARSKSSAEIRQTDRSRCATSVSKREKTRGRLARARLEYESTENDDESNGVRRPSATLGGISVGLARSKSSAEIRQTDRSRCATSVSKREKTTGRLASEIGI